MSISRGLAGLVLVAAMSGSAWTSGAAGPVAVGGTCVASELYPSCTTAEVNDRTFRHIIINPRPLQWYVVACGQGPGSTCDGADWTAGDSRIGTVTATGCPCSGWIYVGYADQIVKGVPYTGIPIGILTNLSP